ncbi:MAG TPA: radical SAM protein [Thermoplasmatales archaeon]|nr:radical SAM protein [Thermoplasmatales archaeon]
MQQETELKNTKILEETYSVCPACYLEGKIKKIPAQIVEEDGKVWITKTCEEHGFFKEIYFGDVKLYKRWMKYKVTGSDVPDVKTQVLDYPALYDVHKSQTVLTNLLVTNRCDLRCNYCFMNAGASGRVYEPSLEQIREMMLQARNEKPMGSKAVQITGGEPTIREDLFEIIRMAKEVGFSHVQVNTNGLKLADSVEYCKRLKAEKVNTIYMSFDGVTPETNPWIEKHKQAIENLRKANLRVVLVPVLIGDKNLHEAGKIVKFALDNMDIVRGVNFQPVSFCGRMEKIKDEKRERQRVDYVKMMEVIEEEFDGAISRDDFYPVPFVFPISRLIEMLKGETQVEFTAHPGCGGATYIFMDDGKPIPVTRFIDVEGLLEFIEKESEIRGPFKKLRVASAFLRYIDKFVDYNRAPKGFNLKKLLKEAVIGGSYDSLRGFHYKSLFVGAMWFQDAFNLNIDRLQRCVIHYATPEGIVPFCAYNGLGIGEKIREKHSIPISEWEKLTGRSIKDDLRKDVPLT